MGGLLLLKIMLQMNFELKLCDSFFSHLKSYLFCHLNQINDAEMYNVQKIKPTYMYVRTVIITLPSTKLNLNT